MTDTDRLIFALDVPEVDQAQALVEKLGDTVSFYKIGLELMMTGGYFKLIDWLLARDKKIFADLKFFDVPATVGRSVARLASRGVHFVTVHGNQAIMEAAAANKGDLKVLAVTALTSLDRGDLDDLGFQCDVRELVLSRARRALELATATLAADVSASQLFFFTGLIDPALISTHPETLPCL